MKSCYSFFTYEIEIVVYALTMSYNYCEDKTVMCAKVVKDAVNVKCCFFYPALILVDLENQLISLPLIAMNYSRCLSN